MVSRTELLGWALLLFFGLFCLYLGPAPSAFSPSRKASVVIPLLKQISPNDFPNAVAAKIKDILGKPDGCGGGGSILAPTISFGYGLDNKGSVNVTFINGKLFDVFIWFSNDQPELMIWHDSQRDVKF